MPYWMHKAEGWSKCCREPVPLWKRLSRPHRLSDSATGCVSCWPQRIRTCSIFWMRARLCMQGLRAIGGPANPKVASLDSQQQLENEVWKLLQPRFELKTNRGNALKAVPREWLLSAPTLVLTDSYGAGAFRGAMFDLDVAAWVLPGASMGQILSAAEVIVRVRENSRYPKPTLIVVVGGVNNALDAYDHKIPMAIAAEKVYEGLSKWMGIPDVEVLVVTPPRVSYPADTKGGCISEFVNILEDMKRNMPLHYRDGVDKP